MGNIKKFRSQPARQVAGAARAQDAFSPFYLPGLSLWLDAADRATLFDADTAGNLQLTDAAAVGRWEDKSGNARHFIQATAGDRPTLGASGANLVNGLQSVVFNAALENGAGSAWMSSGAAAASLFLPLGAGAAGDWCLFIAHQRANQLAQRTLFNDAAGNLLVRNHPSNGLKTQLLAAGGNITEAPDTLATDTSYIHCTRRIAGTGLRIAINGGAETATAWTGNHATSGALCLPGTQANFKQKIRCCEVIALTGADGGNPSAAARNAVGRYLAAKWGAAWTNQVV